MYVYSYSLYINKLVFNYILTILVTYLLYLLLNYLLIRYILTIQKMKHIYYI